jgi:hypothetical protein
MSNQQELGKSVNILHVQQFPQIAEQQWDVRRTAMAREGKGHTGVLLNADILGDAIDSIMVYIYRCKDRGQARCVRILMITRDGISAPPEELMSTLQQNNKISVE